jgi:hypothetical protein
MLSGFAIGHPGQRRVPLLVKHNMYISQRKRRPTGLAPSGFKAGLQWQIGQLTHEIRRQLIVSSVLDTISNLQADLNNDLISVRSETH